MIRLKTNRLIIRDPQETDFADWHRLICESYAKECEWHDGSLKDRLSYRLLKSKWEALNKSHLQSQISSDSQQICLIDETTRELVTAFIKKRVAFYRYAHSR